MTWLPLVTSFYIIIMRVQRRVSMRRGRSLLYIVPAVCGPRCNYIWVVLTVCWASFKAYIASGFPAVMGTWCTNTKLDQHVRVRLHVCLHRAMEDNESAEHAYAWISDYKLVSLPCIWFLLHILLLLFQSVHLTVVHARTRTRVRNAVTSTCGSMWRCARAVVSARDGRWLFASAHQPHPNTE
jgi:hypothetical protein